MTAGQRGSHGVRHMWLIVAAACAAMFALGTLSLGEQSLWFDEGASTAYAHLSLSELARAMTKSDAYFGLYYALLHVWRIPFGESEASVRALSVLGGVAAIAAIAAVAWRLAGALAGAYAAILAVANPFALAFAREARPYSMLVLVSALAALTFLAAARRPSALRWSVFAFTAIVGIYAHLFALLAVASFAIWALFARRDLWSKGLPLALGAVGVAAVPLLLIVSRYGAINTWIERASPRAMLQLLVEFAGSPAALALAALIVAGALWASRKRGAPFDRATVGFAATWLAAPIVIAFLVSYRTPVFVDKYLAEALPALIVGIAIALAAIPRPLAAGALGLWIVLAAPGMRAVYATVVEDWRGAATEVLAQASPADALAIYPRSGIVVYDYYRRRIGHAGPTVIFPGNDVFPFDTHADASAGAVPADASRKSLWVILDPLADDPEGAPNSVRFLATVPHGYVLAQRSRYRRITVLRFDA